MERQDELKRLIEELEYGFKNIAEWVRLLKNSVRDTREELSYANNELRYVVEWRKVKTNRGY